jgi:pyruvate dehydrogenase (quinone)
VVVYNNASLNFVQIEQKVEGLLDNYTSLLNPDFSKVAEAMGLYGRQVTAAAELEGAVEQFLAHPGPALLDVKVNPEELVMPPKIELAQVAGMALYSARAVLGGRATDVKDMLVDNFIK